jgi:hypothetical protein
MIVRQTPGSANRWLSNMCYLISVGEKLPRPLARPDGSFAEIQDPPGPASDQNLL